MFESWKMKRFPGAGTTVSRFEAIGQVATMMLSPDPEEQLGAVTVAGHFFARKDPFYLILMRQLMFGMYERPFLASVVLLPNALQDPDFFEPLETPEGVDSVEEDLKDLLCRWTVCEGMRLADCVSWKDALDVPRIREIAGFLFSSDPQHEEVFRAAGVLLRFEMAEDPYLESGPGQ